MPITPFGIRCQVVHQGLSDLPEDAFVNTFHFRCADPDVPLSVIADDLTPHLDDLYDLDAPSTPLTLHNFMQTGRFSGWSFRWYDLRLPEPRTPEIVVGGSMDTPNSQVCLPEEVAVVCSFRGPPPHTARRRGRIYLGPLNNSANASNAQNVRPNVNVSLRDVIAEVFPRFRLAVLAEGVGDYTWSIYSPTNNNLVNVEDGFVDNSFDTQRRRGTDPTARTNWNVIIP